MEPRESKGYALEVARGTYFLEQIETQMKDNFLYILDQKQLQVRQILHILEYTL